MSIYDGIHPARRPSPTPPAKPRLTTMITVRDLIARLQGCPQDAIVWLEGCDCVGEATGEVTTVGNEPMASAILLRRKP